MTVSVEEPKKPMVTTEIPGPRSRSLLQELASMQVRSKSSKYFKHLFYLIYNIGHIYVDDHLL